MQDKQFREITDSVKLNISENARLIRRLRFLCMLCDYDTYSFHDIVYHFKIHHPTVNVSDIPMNISIEEIEELVTPSQYLLLEQLKDKVHATEVLYNMIIEMDYERAYIFARAIDLAMLSLMWELRRAIHERKIAVLKGG